MCPQENVSPNALFNVATAPQFDEPTRTKRVRKAKRVQRAPSVKAAEPLTGANEERALASPRGSKQRKLSDGSAVLMQHCAGLQVANAAAQEVSPPLSKVQERFGAYAQRAKASAARGASSLASCIVQADGSRRGELDHLSHTVAGFRLGGGAYF